jgi:diadenylate cyclase
MEWFVNAMRWPQMGWLDVLDIAIVSVAIYELLKLIRGTRAIQMALGAAFLVGIFYLSQYGRLETVNWLIRNAFGYIVFAAIVIFQADIRRALAHFGRARFVRYFAPRESDEDTVEELAVAVTVLSNQRIGAILVMERDIGLRNYIEGGIPLDATLTHDLVLSVFQPEAPLHDGAMMIQGDRIAAAACFLPLTVNPRISKEYGTRHRAAIGLTEETDAVAVVVSEETGRIAMALDGAIEPDLSPETLRARLRPLLLKRRSGSERGQPHYAFE